MDNVDLEIFEMLKIDARVSITDISKAINLSRPSVQERIKKMIDNGIIVGFTLNTSLQKLGYNIVFYMTISELKVPYDNIVEILKENSNIIEMSVVTGKVNYIVKAATVDVESMHLLLSRLRKFSQVETLIILDEIIKPNILTPILK